jgi:hypothetical protein
MGRDSSSSSITGTVEYARRLLAASDTVLTWLFAVAFKPVSVTKSSRIYNSRMDLLSSTARIARQWNASASAGSVRGFRLRSVRGLEF